MARFHLPFASEEFLLAGCALPSRDTNAISESVISGSVKDNTDAPVHGAETQNRYLAE